jgi:glycosyltransferase involved in cell wall biosynthesis
MEAIKLLAGLSHDQAAAATPVPVNAVPVPTPVNADPVPVADPAPAPADVVTVADIVKPKESSTDGKLRVLFCGTYPVGQSNGYSRVVYYIAKYLGMKTDIALTIYGFQNFKQTFGNQRSGIPSNVILHDAFATEDPKRNGFGEKEIGKFLKENPQDLIIIFNDMVITSALVHTIVTELSEAERATFKMVSYMDQVYPYQKRQYINILNACFDAVITFTPYWRDVVRRIGLRPEIPCYVFPHGFDYELYYPIPKRVARIYYNIPDDAFVILNLNRNQPRKRWDHTMMAFADVVKRQYDMYQKAKRDNLTLPRPVKLMIATTLDGYWNLGEVFENELREHGVPIEYGQSCLITLTKPQQMSDRDINILYNACDVGLNTCEGEGFGLCQIEHAAVAHPQIAPRIGGLQDFLADTHSCLIEPKWKYYIDKHRDGIGGIAEVGDPKDYANAIWKYYIDQKLFNKHAIAARKYILRHYRWTDVVDNFYSIIKTTSAAAKNI